MRFKIKKFFIVNAVFLIFTSVLCNKVSAQKPVVYWKGNNIINSNNPVQEAANVINRGFTHAVTTGDDYTNATFLSNNGFSIIQNIMFDFIFVSANNSKFI